MSIFQAHPPTQPILPFSFGVEQAIIADLGQHTAITEDALIEAVVRGFGLVLSEDEIKANVSTLVQRVLHKIEEHQQSAEGSESSRPAKTLGSGYAEWLTNLSSEQACLYLANYDVGKAYDYYWKYDADMVKEAIKVKSQQENQASLLQFEAVMYGMGGQYKNDGASANILRLDEADQSDAVAALKACGF